MIVKNEEEFIAQCIRSVRSIVSEIILADTGTTDRTIDIAAELGAVVYPFEWTNDFSAARNFSLELASSDWILVLDADEAIAERDLEQIRQATMSPGVCYEFLQRHYTNDHRLSDFKACEGAYPEFERHYAGYFESNLCRLFPNHKGIHYRGRVHELVEHSIREIAGLRIERCRVPIHHYGHTPEVKKKKVKNELYGPLGETKAKEQPADWKAYFELGVEHNCSGRLEESAAAFERSVRLNGNYLETWVNYGYVLCELGRYDEAESALKRGLALSPRHEQAYCNLGVVYMRQNRFPDAVAVLNRAIEINPGYVNAFCNLGISLARLGRLSEAANAYKRALEAMPQCVPAKADLGALYLTVGELDEAERLLRSALENDPECGRAMFTLGTLLKRKGQLGEAADEFERYCRVEEKRGNILPEIASQVEALRQEIAGLRKRGQ